MVALLSGIGAFIGTNSAIGIARAIASSMSQFMLVLLRFSYFSLPIRMVGWFAATWAGLSAYDAMSGF
ncbi:hypothetical protein DEM27_12420 [Metarhizobium album]|uniref:Uncharacterized protein n=1 Tax=Metarhizobium album TaxID=2182425 RepID=A0A2U2DSD8_9HYPH|nr:hypothetical protein [Rhizobium album]PWE56224.1 hypothetical protein DEM27_12420 [Rhizobium album]